MIEKLLLAVALGQPIQSPSETSAVPVAEGKARVESQTVAADEGSPLIYDLESIEGPIDYVDTQPSAPGGFGIARRFYESWELSSWYSRVDALFLWRDDARQRPFAFDSATGQTALSSSDIDFPLRAGIEGMIGFRLDTASAVEFTYLHMGDSTDTAAAARPGNTLDLALDGFAPIAAPLFRDLSRVDMQATSKLWSSEIRFVHSFRDGTDHPYRLDLFAGPRFIGFEESLHVQTSSPTGVRHFSDILAENMLYGGQIGLRGAMRNVVENLDAEGALQVGLFGNNPFLRQTHASAGLPLAPIRAENKTTGFAQMVEGRFDLRYKVSQAFHLSAGYRVMFLAEVARATEQFPTDLGNIAADRHGDVFFHGFTLGARFQWGQRTDPNCRSGCCTPYIIQNRCCP